MQNQGGLLREVSTIVIQLTGDVLVLWKSGHLQEVVAHRGSTAYKNKTKENFPVTKAPN